MTLEWTHLNFLVPNWQTHKHTECQRNIVFNNLFMKYSWYRWSTRSVIVPWEVEQDVRGSVNSPHATEAHAGWFFTSYAFYKWKFLTKRIFIENWFTPAHQRIYCSTSQICPSLSSAFHLCHYPSPGHHLSLASCPFYVSVCLQSVHFHILAESCFKYHSCLLWNL